MEVRDPYAWWERFLAFKSLVETFAKIWLDAQSLQHKHAHANQALFCGVVALIDCVVQHQYHEIVSSVSVDDKRTEALVALQSFPKEHDHLGCPSQ